MHATGWIGRWKFDESVISVRSAPPAGTKGGEEGGRSSGGIDDKMVVFDGDVDRRATPWS